MEIQKDGITPLKNKREYIVPDFQMFVYNSDVILASTGSRWSDQWNNWFDEGGGL